MLGDGYIHKIYLKINLSPSFPNNRKPGDEATCRLILTIQPTLHMSWMRWVCFASQVESETPGTIASTWCTPLDPPDQSVWTWSAASCRTADTGNQPRLHGNDDLYHTTHYQKYYRGTPSYPHNPLRPLHLNTLFLAHDRLYFWRKFEVRDQV